MTRAGRQPPGGSGYPTMSGSAFRVAGRICPRYALEALIIDAYRREVLTAAEVQGILGLPARHDAETFLEEAEADIGYTGQDLEDDLRAFAKGSLR